MDSVEVEPLPSVQPLCTLLIACPESSLFLLLVKYAEVASASPLFPFCWKKPSRPSRPRPFESAITGIMLKWLREENKISRQLGKTLSHQVFTKTQVRSTRLLAREHESLLITREWLQKRSLSWAIIANSATKPLRWSPTKSFFIVLISLENRLANRFIQSCSGSGWRKPKSKQ